MKVGQVPCPKEKQGHPGMGLKALWVTRIHQVIVLVVTMFALLEMISNCGPSFIAFSWLVNCSLHYCVMQTFRKCCLNTTFKVLQLFLLKNKTQAWRISSLMHACVLFCFCFWLEWICYKTRCLFFELFTSSLAVLWLPKSWLPCWFSR